MKRKLFATLGLVVASMMVFAGCGGSGDATTSPVRMPTPHRAAS